MIFPTIMFWVWMAAQSGTISVQSVTWDNDLVYRTPPPQTAEHVIEIRTPQPYYLLQYPSNGPKVGQIMVPCGNPQKDANGGTIQQYCWVYPKSKRRERGQ